MIHKTAHSDLKIGFIYYTFYPVTGGASVHGYNLAKELYKQGYELFKINGDSDPFTHRLENPVTGLFWILVNCDLIYIRLDYFLNFRNLISILALLSGKKMIVELNSPSDELHLFGRSEKYIHFVDSVVSKILRSADAVITVSDPLKRYCEEALQLTNVHVIENGGEIFIETPEGVSNAVKQKMQEIKQKYSKTVVWSGSANDMQDLKKIEAIAEAQKNKSAVVCIIKKDQERGEVPSSNENLYVFKNLPRDDVKYIISNSEIGLALYRGYPWSRWGFYNSSLKVFEYLNNGLLTITNTAGTEIQKSHPNFRSADTEEEITALIDQFKGDSYDPEKSRTWSKVAEETSRIIQQVTNR